MEHPNPLNPMPEVSMEDALFFSDTNVYVRPIQRYGQILCEVYATWPESTTTWLVAECFAISNEDENPNE